MHTLTAEAQLGHHAFMEVCTLIKCNFIVSQFVAFSLQSNVMSQMSIMSELLFPEYCTLRQGKVSM